MCYINAIFWPREDAVHYNDVIMGARASQITSLTIVYSIVHSDADQRKHQLSASLAFVRGIHRGPQVASYAENVSIWWRHHAFVLHVVWYNWFDCCTQRFNSEQWVQHRFISTLRLCKFSRTWHRWRFITWEHTRSLLSKHSLQSHI